MRRILLGMTMAIISTAMSARAALQTRLLDAPDSVQVVTAEQTVDLSQAAEPGVWAADSFRVLTTVNASGVVVTLHSPAVPVKRVHLRWKKKFATNAKFLGDTWERAYADMEWKAIDPARPMPWYFLIDSHNPGDQPRTDAVGVMTGPGAFCCWKVDESGIDLLADVRCGGVGVELGDRTLAVCTVVSRTGSPDESSFTAAREFCRQMCPHPRLPKQPVYGFNDWYCNYGKNTAEGFLSDASYISGLCPKTENRPFMVIDDGWQANRQGDKPRDDPWDRTNSKFGSTMPEVASAIKAMHARPGLWYRALEAWPDAPQEWRLKNRHLCLDPSVPEVKANVAASIRRFRDWGYEMIKHDFTTEEITGHWGNQMGEQIAPDGWSFADRSRTTAEIILDLYKTIRDAAGDDVLVNGCNTVTHLSAGVFEMQRIGDDTSGQEWKRTRDYGVNCLAFRAAQHGTFYFVDADCAGLAKANAVPWEKNSQWLDLLSRSGTPLFVSWPQRLVGNEQEQALKDALSRAAGPQPLAEPTDWESTRTPTRWKSGEKMLNYDW